MDGGQGEGGSRPWAKQVCVGGQRYKLPVIISPEDGTTAW